MPDPRPPLAEVPSARNIPSQRRHKPKLVPHQDGAGDTENATHMQPETSDAKGNVHHDADTCRNKHSSPQQSSSHSEAPLSQPSLQSPYSFSSPHPSILEPADPPELSDSYDELWQEVSSHPHNNPLYRYHATLSSVSSMEEQERIATIMVSQEQDTFKWNNTRGKLTKQQWVLHCLYYLDPEAVSGQQQISKHAGLTFELIPSSPLDAIFTAESTKISSYSHCRWAHFILERLFPFGTQHTQQEYLLAELGPYDLSKLPSGQAPAARPPERTYSLTARVFPAQYRELAKAEYLLGSEYSAPYLTVFLPEDIHEDQSERMRLWGQHMLLSRVAEWCRVQKLYLLQSENVQPKTGSTMLPPPLVRASSTTAKTRPFLQARSGQHSRSQSSAPQMSQTRATSRPCTQATIEQSSMMKSHDDEPLTGVPAHYCVLVTQTSFSVCKFVPILRKKFGDVEKQNIQCFRKDVVLVDDDDWGTLRSDILGIHSVSVIHGGRLVSKATESMHRNKSASQAPLGVGALDIMENPWVDDKRDWKSAGSETEWEWSC